MAEIKNRFRHTTLVNKDKTGGIAIDTSLEFHNFAIRQTAPLTEKAIIEWRHTGADF